jgi:DNA-binding NarL/FixJ family response regulator
MPVTGISPFFTVFIVDDSSIVVERLTIMLCELPGVAVCGCADNAQDALIGIALYGPDAVIVDINLKKEADGVNGISLLATLRELYPGKLLIMLTNHATPQYSIKCRALGADYFFDKSIEFDAVQETIKAYMLPGGRNLINPEKP